MSELADLAPPVKEALESLFETFSRYPKPRHLERSPLRDYGSDKKKLDHLLSADLIETAGDAIASYSAWAMTTVGNANDYQYFLPRILLELGRSQSELFQGPEEIAAKLLYGEWHNWPDNEKHSVRDFFRACSTETLKGHPADIYPGFSSWWAALIMLGEAPECALTIAENAKTPMPSLHMAWLIQDHEKEIMRHGQLSGPYWEDLDNAVVQRATDMLLSDEMLAFIEANQPPLPEEELDIYWRPAIERVKALRNWSAETR